MATDRSANMSFMVSAITWVLSAEWKPIPLKSKFSRMLSIWMIWLPPEEGGDMEMMSQPR